MISRAGRKPQGETMKLVVRDFPADLNERFKKAIRLYAPGSSKHEAAMEAIEEWIERRAA